MTAVIRESRETSGSDCKWARARLCAIWLFWTSPWPQSLALLKPTVQKQESYAAVSEKKRKNQLVLFMMVEVGVDEIM